MNETNLSRCESELVTLRPASAEVLADSILKSLRLEELRNVRRKAMSNGLFVGAFCGATTTAVALFLAFACSHSEIEQVAPQRTAAMMIYETDPFFDELDDIIRYRSRAKTFEPNMPPNRDRYAVQQLLQELATGRPDI